MTSSFHHFSHGTSLHHHSFMEMIFTLVPPIFSDLRMRACLRNRNNIPRPSCTRPSVPDQRKYGVVDIAALVAS